jgi:hypothetical protein
MILGNVEKFKGKGLVAFIDILGFSKEIETKWDDKEDNPLDKLLELKKHLPIHTDKDLKDVENKNISRVYMCRVQTISDSVVVSFGFDENVLYGDMIMGTIAFFDIISVIWRKSLEAGFTVRGAADFGSIYWDEKEIIGPAFINAYKLEMNNAKSSRIIISSTFNRNLKKMFEQATTFWNDEILKILRKDNDGYIVTNPHKLYDTEEDKQHVIKLLINLRDKASLLNKEKYSPILAALNTDKYNLTKEDLGQY